MRHFRGHLLALCFAALALPACGGLKAGDSVSLASLSVLSSGELFKGYQAVAHTTAYTQRIQTIRSMPWSAFTKSFKNAPRRNVRIDGVLVESAADTTAADHSPASSETPFKTVGDALDAAGVIDPAAITSADLQEGLKSLAKLNAGTATFSQAEKSSAIKLFLVMQARTPSGHRATLGLVDAPPTDLWTSASVTPICIVSTEQCPVNRLIDLYNKRGYKTENITNGQNVITGVRSISFQGDPRWTCNTPNPDENANTFMAHCDAAINAKYPEAGAGPEISTGRESQILPGKT